MPLLNDADAIYLGATPVDAVYLGADKVWPPTQPAKVTGMWEAQSSIFANGLFVDTSAGATAMNVWFAYTDGNAKDQTAALRTVQVGDTVDIAAIAHPFKLHGVVTAVNDNTLFNAYGVRLVEAETASPPPDGTFLIVTIT